MFPSSSHRKYWLFKDDQELNLLRERANQDFIEKHRYKVKGMNEEEASKYFLNKDEERTLLQFYESQLLDFCKGFTPLMPKQVYGTAFHYMKRFYIYNSVMDFHPKEILVTCVFLACKVEEFNVTVQQFVLNVKGDRDRATDIILNNELILMEKLNYQLIVYNVYKPMEGLILDVKVRGNRADAEDIVRNIDEIIDTLYLSDACLLYTPSQLALALILHNASRNKKNLDEYVTKTLLGNDESRHLGTLIGVVRKIRTILTVTKPKDPSIKDNIKLIQRRLERCRNEENNPSSKLFKQKMKRMFYDEEDLEEEYEKSKNNNSS